MTTVLYNDLLALNNAICHYGKKGQEWYKNKADRYQRHAKYAMGRPNPGGDTSGSKKKRKESADDVEAIAREYNDKVSTLTPGIPFDLDMRKERDRSIYKAWRDFKGKTGMYFSFDQSKQYDWGFADDGIDTEDFAVERLRASKKTSNQIMPEYERFPEFKEKFDRIMAEYKAKKDAEQSAGIGSYQVTNYIPIRSKKIKRRGLTLRIEEDRVREGLEADPTMGNLRKKPAAARSESIDEDAKNVNPDYYSDAKKGTKNNCVLCCAAYEMRRRGYEVQADRAGAGADTRLIDSRWFRGAEHSVAMFKSGTKADAVYNNVADYVKRQGEGARGTISILWDGWAYGGHAMNYTVEKGKLVIIDSQQGKVFREAAAVNMLKDVTKVELNRLDNVNSSDIHHLADVTRLGHTWYMY